MSHWWCIVCYSRVERYICVCIKQSCLVRFYAFGFQRSFRGGVQAPTIITHLLIVFIDTLFNSFCQLKKEKKHETMNVTFVIYPFLVVWLD